LRTPGVNQDRVEGMPYAAFLNGGVRLKGPLFRYLQVA